MNKIIKFSLVGAFLLLLGFTLQSCDTAKEVVGKVENTELTSKLKGVWFLTSIEGANTADLFKGPIPSITFDLANHRVSGSGGCNNYTGGFSLLGNIFTPTPMASTMMACAHENKEDKFLELLGKKSTLVMNNYSLQFVQNGKVVLEFLPRAR